ncbi:YfiT family bacillithiol transferase [Gorillibacterium timonense]|uniref:YfiT family bacillithiol transferase n=1 Tax=Gorillibacterium timonense TaxID=1689269 RepID=UPI00071E1E92|nr:bacillithiol transferase BstA [Gorillibacterium timonense]
MDFRYPIGTFEWQGEITREQREQWISDIAELPALLATEIRGLSDEQLDTPYREGGWTIRQVVHHLADSHMNSFIRFKLALTEDRPTIRPYYEDRWAEGADARLLHPEVSLRLLESLHERWVFLLRTISDEDYARDFYHPESEAVVRLDYNVGVYSWHGWHHLAHIRTLKERKGWT